MDKEQSVTAIFSSSCRILRHVSALDRNHNYEYILDLRKERLRAKQIPPLVIETSVLQYCLHFTVEVLDNILNILFFCCFGADSMIVL